mmetsp:Transcript_55292/g.83663  ORF Transcript_55292/g.83663 Transcript_55292/m.83663 type:complete len:245 (+) Transcript_55292:529-1263(+)
MGYGLCRFVPRLVRPRQLDQLDRTLSIGRGLSSTGDLRAGLQLQFLSLGLSIRRSLVHHGLRGSHHADDLHEGPRLGDQLGQVSVPKWQGRICRRPPQEACQVETGYESELLLCRSLLLDLDLWHHHETDSNHQWSSLLRDYRPHDHLLSSARIFQLCYLQKGNSLPLQAQEDVTESRKARAGATATTKAWLVWLFPKKRARATRNFQDTSVGSFGSILGTQGCWRCSTTNLSSTIRCGTPIGV